MKPNDPGRIAALLSIDEELVRQLQARGRLLDPHLNKQHVRERLFDGHRAWATRHAAARQRLERRPYMTNRYR